MHAVSPPGSWSSRLVRLPAVWRDLAGPAVFEMKQLVRDYLDTTRKRRLTLPVRLPGKAGKAYRGGQNLTLDGDHGTHTWEEFLAAV
jgi:hypothetical protein